jgi:hypothetical protein
MHYDDAARARRAREERREMDRVAAELERQRQRDQAKKIDRRDYTGQKGGR